MSVKPVPVAVETPRPAVSVEIETLAKGAPKISVRVDGEDGTFALEQALTLWKQATDELEEYIRG